MRRANKQSLENRIRELEAENNELRRQISRDRKIEMTRAERQQDFEMIEELIDEAKYIVQKDLWVEREDEKEVKPEPCIEVTLPNGEKRKIQRG